MLPGWRLGGEAPPGHIQTLARCQGPSWSVCGRSRANRQSIRLVEDTAPTPGAGTGGWADGEVNGAHLSITAAPAYGRWGSGSEVHREGFGENCGCTPTKQNPDQVEHIHSRRTINDRANVRQYGLWTARHCVTVSHSAVCVSIRKLSR